MRIHFKLLRSEALIYDDQSDKICQVLNTTILPQDSILLKKVHGDRLSLRNYGQNKDYGLNIIYFSTDQQSIFKHEKIELIGNANHMICADWNNLENQPVKIFVDENIDGVIDDTLFIENQATSVEDHLSGPPTTPTIYKLSQNYPNPFNATTSICFALAKPGTVKIDLYSILGQHVAELLNENKSAGEHTIQFDSNNLSSGIYLYRMRVGNFCQTQKMILLK